MRCCTEVRTIIYCVYLIVTDAGGGGICRPRQGHVLVQPSRTFQTVDARAGVAHVPARDDDQGRSD